jgi:hypothetical protein
MRSPAMLRTPALLCAALALAAWVALAAPPAKAAPPVWVEITSGAGWAEVTAGQDHGTDVFFNAAPGQPITFKVDPWWHWDGDVCWRLKYWTKDVDLAGPVKIPGSDLLQEITLNVEGSSTMDIAAVFGDCFSGQ